jgi:hypothetical protein
MPSSKVVEIAIDKLRELRRLRGAVCADRSEAGRDEREAQRAAPNIRRSDDATSY